MVTIEGRTIDHKHMTGYNSVKSDSYQCISPNGAQMHCGNDFIPLNISTPVTEQKRLSGNWHGASSNRNYRNSGNGRYNHYRNNYHATPKSNFNNSYSPYKYSGKQFYGQKKVILSRLYSLFKFKYFIFKVTNKCYRVALNVFFHIQGYHKDAQKYINISSYVDYKSFLEDPWAELVKKLNKSEDANGQKSPKREQLLSVQSVYVNSETAFENKSVVEVDDSCFSEESKSESSLNVTLGLDDTDISSLSQTRSSIDRFETRQYEIQSRIKRRKRL